MLHREDRRRWSDAELLSAIAARDGAAFGVFYRRHLPVVLAFLLRQTGPWEHCITGTMSNVWSATSSSTRPPTVAPTGRPWVQRG
jgi:hypothetical protein